MKRKYSGPARGLKRRKAVRTYAYQPGSKLVLDEEGFAPRGPPSRLVRRDGLAKGYRQLIKRPGACTTRLALLQNWLGSLIQTSHFTSCRRDMQYSTANTLTRKINCAVVKDYGFRLETLNLYWAADTTFPVYASSQANLKTIQMNITRDYVFRNTTNYSLYVYSKRCVAKQDVPDDKQPSQCWQFDLTNTSAGTVTFGNDANNEYRSIFNTNCWILGGKGTEFSTYWSADEWERSLLPPGKEVKWQAIDRISMIKKDYDRLVSGDATVFCKGMTVYMVKVIAEEAITTQTAQTENAIEALDRGATFSAPVEFLETCYETIRVRVVPGFQKNVVQPISQLVTDVAGGMIQYGKIIDMGTSMPAGQVYSAVGGSLVAPLNVSDLNQSVEPVAEQHQGVDEGFGAFRVPMDPSA